MTENRVLTLAEVLALEDGKAVWVEERIYKSKPQTLRRNYCDSNEFGGDDEIFPVALVTHEHKFWPIEVDAADHYFGRDYRVWSLPRPPTPEEMAANPWPALEDAKD